MLVDSLPIDDQIIEILKKQGIQKLYPPQAEAIKTRFIEEGKNLVVSIPTASGKTLIAKIAIAQRLLDNGGKAVYLTPLKALAKEKYDELKAFLTPLGFKTIMTTGDYDSDDGWLGNYDVIVTTNEKFDSILRRIPGWLETLSIIISDEVHFMGSKDRGPVLEIVLTQIRRKYPIAQVLALSATISNAKEIADWLDAELITSKWRPVELKEGVYFDNVIEFKDGEEIELENEFKDPYITLAIDAYRLGGQALVFASTRASAETSAEQIGKKLKQELNVNEKKALKTLAEQIENIGEKTLIRDKLVKVIKNGTAFHHAGLHYTHREIIEQAFKQNILKVISSTPTLAAGVNLPARVVVIRSLRRYEMGYGNTWIPVNEYKQMAGRAGRPQYDDVGEAIVTATNKKTKDFIFKNYINAETEPIMSNLGVEPVLRKLTLSLIVTGDSTNLEEILEFVELTFFGYVYGSAISYIETRIKDVLSMLKINGLIKQGIPLEPTRLGTRVAELYVDPLTAVIIKEGLEKASTLVEVPELSYLHLIATTPDMRTFFTKKSEEEQLDEIYQQMMSYLLTDLPETNSEVLLEYQALKTALVLNDWINEVHENDIILKYGIGSGDILSIVNLADWLLYSASEIARVLSYDEEKEFLTELQFRVKYGVKKELLELIKIPGIGRVRARILYDNGYPSIHEIAAATVDEIARLPKFGKTLAQQLIKYAKGEINSKDLEQKITSEKYNTKKKLDEYF